MVADDRFKAMEPGVYSPTALHDLPVLICRSPVAEGESVSLQVSRELLEKYQGHNRNSKLYEVWANIYGRVPPVNCIGVNEGEKEPPLVSITEAYRSYRGLERGYNEQDNGEEIYILITQPEYTYEFMTSMVCPAKCIKLEEGTVMATYIKMNSPGHGEIIGWDFVPGENDGRITVPVNSVNRYKGIVW